VKAEIGETFLTCLQCGTCTSICPVNLISSYSPRQILRQLAMKTGTEQSVDQAVWSCFTCNACGVNCPRGIPIIEVIKAVRGLNVAGGRIPESFEAPLNSLKENGNPWGGLRENRTEWAKDLDLPAFKAEHEYCLFTCCTTAYDPGIRKAGQALPRLLEYAGVSFGSLGTEENCCGDQAHKIGAGDIFSELSRKNTELFLRADVRKILTVSPHCLNAFKNLYTDLRGFAGAEHYSELLDRLLAEGRLKPALEVASVVTYHDPCYLGRHNGIYEAPRRVLQSIPGLKLVEMTNNRESSLCCGGGGGGAWNDFPYRQNLGVLRIKEALGTGAEMIATACPYCIRMLDHAVRELRVEKQIAVCDLAELLLRSVMVRDETTVIGHIDLGISREVCHV